MRWQPKSYDTMPWWGWALIPAWGPALLLLVAFIYSIKAKRGLVGPSDQWRTWFAWYPIRLPSNGGAWPPVEELVWLEWVERRAAHPLGDPEYRSPLTAGDR